MWYAMVGKRQQQLAYQGQCCCAAAHKQARLKLQCLDSVESRTNADTEQLSTAQHGTAHSYVLITAEPRVLTAEDQK